MHWDPTATIAEDGDDEVDVDTAAVAHTGPPPPSLHAMMETIMTTQATHRQLLHGLLAEVTALQADLADYRHPIPPSPPSDSCDCHWPLYPRGGGEFFVVAVAYLEICMTVL